jgi:glycerophosphoryl diester phosphodiesterase
MLRKPMLLLAAAAAVAATIACAAEPPPVAVIAHRGASWDAPEHTVAAWDLARTAGADWLEFDLQRTADGVLVVFHDDSLDRVARGPVADCSGLVRERTIAQLRRCEIGSWFNATNPDRARASYVELVIPTLDEVLARYGESARLYIELKDPASAPGMERDLLAALAANGRLERLVRERRLLVQSFSPPSLEQLHARAPTIPLIQLVHDSVPAAELPAALARVAGYARGIGPSRTITDSTLVATAHAKGLTVHPYTVNDEALMRRLIRLGVDGMFTDRPGLLRSVLADRAP